MEKQQKSIVFFGSQVTTGGAQRVLLDQAAWFAEAGYRVHAVFFYDKDGILKDWQAANPFPVTALSTYTRGAGAVKNLRGVVSGFLQLIHLLRTEKPDIIECFTHDADLFGIPAAFLAGVPKRFGAHHGQFAGMSKIVRKLHTCVINSGLTRMLICVSERAKAQALDEGIHEDKLTVIRNGVRSVPLSPETRTAVREELCLSPDEKMVLSVARLVPEKAQTQLIAAADTVLHKHPEARFFIAGDGPLKATLQKEITSRNLDAHFTLLGNRTDVPRLLNGADIFVLYSETEGMPVSVMEAMSAGLPVIASDLAGIRQLIPDEETGSLLPFGSPDALAEEIIRHLESPEICHSQGNKAQNRIRTEFSIEASCRSYEEQFVTENPFIPVGSRNT